jgi:polyisoprenoid-binding protein YceI
MIKHLALTLPLLLLAPAARAVEVQSKAFEVTYHIAHPAKEFDGKLLSGGGKANLIVDPGDLSATGVGVEIDVGRFNSENERRDSHMMEVLEGLLFPTISWGVAGVGGVTGPMAPGEYTVQAKGPLTVHGVTHELDIPVKLTVKPDGAVRAFASFAISLDKYEIERPSLLFVKIEDTVPITVTIDWPATPSIFPPDEPSPPAEPPPAQPVPTGDPAAP